MTSTASRALVPQPPVWLITGRSTGPGRDANRAMSRLAAPRSDFPAGETVACGADFPVAPPERGLVA